MNRKMLGMGFAAAAMLATAPVMAAGDAQNRKVLVQNISSQAVAALYASPITSTAWEEDLLGKDTIEAGSDLTANIDNGTTQCFYDLKAIMTDGKSYERRKVNVCEVIKWVIGDKGESLQ